MFSYDDYDYDDDDGHDDDDDDEYLQKQFNVLSKSRNKFVDDVCEGILRGRSWRLGKQ